MDSTKSGESFLFIKSALLPLVSPRRTPDVVCRRGGDRRDREGRVSGSLGDEHAAVTDEEVRDVPAPAVLVDDRVGGAVPSGTLDLDTLADLDDADATACLRELYGVGRWSAEYVLLRGLGRLEIFPADDVGARKSLQLWLGQPSALGYEAACRAVADWYPFAGLVYFHLLLSRLAASGHISDQGRQTNGG